MPHYMLQFRYSPQTWAGLRQQPEDRTAAVRALLEGVGGRLLGLYWTLDDYDGIVILEAPDNLAVASAMAAVKSTGAVETIRLVPLFTAAEGRQLLDRAGETTYRPPAMAPTFLDQSFRARKARRASSAELMAKQEFRVEEASQLFGISPYVIRTAVYSRELPAAMIGQSISSIKRADLLQWLAQRGGV